MHILTINEKKGHEFERECRGIYRRILKGEREEKKYCNYIMISKGSKEEKMVSTVLFQAGGQRVNTNIFKFTYWVQ